MSAEKQETRGRSRRFSGDLSGVIQRARAAGDQPVGGPGGLIGPSAVGKADNPTDLLARERALVQFVGC